MNAKSAAQLFQRRFASIVCLIGLVLLLGNPCTGSAQFLTIEGQSIPDTAYQNNPINISVKISNAIDSSLLGNLKIWFKNQTRNGLVQPLGGFSASQFFAPFQERIFDVEIPIEPEFFLDGGNTVVIWPSFIGQPDAALDSIVLNMFVINPNSTGEQMKAGPSAYFFTNPVTEVLSVQPIGDAKLPTELIIRDVNGRLMIHRKYSDGGMNVAGLNAGIYFLEIKLPDSSSIVRRVVKTGN